MFSEATVLVAVLAGLASFVSPCVLPLLPGYLSLMSGYSVDELQTGEVSLRRVTGKTLLFIGGFTAVFVALGAGATSVGSFLFNERSFFQTALGWVVIVMGLFIAISAVWTPRFMLPFMQDTRIEVRPSKLGPWAPPVMGAAFAFGWTPCLGPFLGATLALGAASETVGRGMLLLFFYSLGLAIPFLISSLALAKAFATFARLRRWLTPITVVSGLMLATFGFLLVTDRLFELNAFFSDLLTRFGLENLTEI